MDFNHGVLTFDLADINFRYNKQYLRLEHNYQNRNPYTTFGNPDLSTANSYGGMREMLVLQYHDPQSNLCCNSHYDMASEMHSIYKGEESKERWKYIVNLMVRDIEHKLDKHMIEDKMAINAPRNEIELYSQFLKSLEYNNNDNMNYNPNILQPTLKYIERLKELNLPEIHLTTTPSFMWEVDKQRFAGTCEAYSGKRLEQIFIECDYDRFTFYCAHEVIDPRHFGPQLKIRASFHNLRKKLEFMAEVDRMLHLLREKVKNFTMFERDEAGMIYSPYVPVDLGQSIWDYKKRIKLTNLTDTSVPNRKLKVSYTKEAMRQSDGITL